MNLYLISKNKFSKVTECPRVFAELTNAMGCSFPVVILQEECCSEPVLAGINGEYNWQIKVRES